MEIEQLLNQYSKMLSFRRLFLRDIAISPKVFIYFLIEFLFAAVIINFIIASIFTYTPEELSGGIGIVTVISIFAAIAISGVIVDTYINRMHLIIFPALFSLLGLVLIIFGSFWLMIGFAITIFSTGLYVINLVTILIHETTILNRGRILSYLFLLSFIGSSIVLFLLYPNVIGILIVECIIFLCLLYIYLTYKYIETKERLTSPKKFGSVLKETNLFGYTIAFIFLGYVLGNAFPLDIEFKINNLLFLLFFFGTFLIVGLSIDNLGRKWTFAGFVLFLAALVTFSGLFLSEPNYNAVFLGISVPSIFVLLFTFSGDFSTERSSIKYRGRLISYFISVALLGSVLGILLHSLFMNLYLNNPEFLYWIPVVLQGLSPFLLILVLVIIIPLPELLSAREADWSESIRNLYVFNSSSICLYNKEFYPDLPDSNLPNEDLITGGFSGILNLITEITNEKKHLRIIDKEGLKIYFAYGKNVIVALISTKYLPILFRKLEQFTKAFEKQYEYELEEFQGKVSVFESAENLINEFFK